MNRTVVIHSLKHARAAMAAAAEAGAKVTLYSAEGAAGNAGPGWFRELIEIARSEYPDVSVTAVLDCGDAPGYALAALRAGCPAIHFSGRRLVKAKIRSIAKDTGAVLHERRGAMLDLFGAPDPEAACRAWFSRRHIRAKKPNERHARRR